VRTYRSTTSLQLGTDLSAWEVEAFAGAVLDMLHELAGPVDPDLTASLAQGQVIIEFDLPARDPADAHAQAATLIQTALHACDADTADLMQAAGELVTTVRETPPNPLAV
jgi:hypothetical protein